MNELRIGFGPDSGDLIHLLPTIRRLGGGDVHFMDVHGRRAFTPRIPLLKRLLELQAYIGQVLPHSGEKLDYDFSDFRKNGMPWGVQLGKIHSDYFNIPTDFSKPWLDCPKSPYTDGRIIVSKTARYANPLFPWKELVAAFRDQMLFVGLSGEHRDFCVSYGQVEYLPTADLYEVATAIAGSDLFIGCQSSPNAIAEGLKHPMIQEVCLWACDCIYKRSNAIHCYDGSLEFYFNGTHFRHERGVQRKKIARNITPLGGWKMTVGNNKLNHYDFRSIMMLAQREYEVSRKPVPDDLARLIEEATFPEPEILPDPPQLLKVKALIEGSGEPLPVSS